jgi:hypothetical protein
LGCGFIRWLGVTLEVLGNLMVLAAMIFAIIGRETLTPGAAGLSISYALTVRKKDLNFLLRIPQ